MGLIIVVAQKYLAKLAKQGFLAQLFILSALRCFMRANSCRKCPRHKTLINQGFWTGERYRGHPIYKLTAAL